MGLKPPASTGSGGGGTSTSQVDGDDALGQFELMPMVPYGHSWVANDNQTPGAKWYQRLASRLRSGTVTARGSSGEPMATVAMKAHETGSQPWTARTKALVLLICSINDISLYGTSPTSMLLGYRRALRSFLAIVTGNNAVAANTTSFVYSSGWTTETPSTGGTRFTTSMVGAYTEFTFTGTGCDLFLLAKTAGAGLVTVTEGGTTIGTIDLTDPVSQEVTAVFRIRSLAAGTHTIRATLTSGASLTVHSYRVPLTSPPPVLVIGEPLVTWEDKSFGTTAGQAMLTDQIKPAAADIVSEFANARYLDAQTSDWDPATMRNDSRHPNDKGSAYLTRLALRALAAFGWTPGLHVLGIGGATPDAAYVPPTGPTIPVGGQDGTGTAASGPAVAPSKVTGLSGTSGDGQATLTWVAPGNGGATITDYVIQKRTSPSGSWSTVADGASAATTTTVTGLTNGTAMDFQVAAVNSAGTGPYSDPVTVTPAASSGGSASPTVEDTFQRTDTTDDSAPATPVGGKASSIFPTSGVTWGIVSGRAKPTSGGNSIKSWPVDSSDGIFETQIGAGPTNKIGGLVIDHDGAGNALVLAERISSSVNQYALQRMIAGASPQALTLQNGSVTGTASGVDSVVGDMVRVRRQGQRVQVYLNSSNTPVIDVLVAGYTNARAGFYGNFSAGGTLAHEFFRYSPLS